MKILILTAVYPRPDAPKQSTATRVIQYFAAEWKKSGHDVVVVHTANRLLRPVYSLPESIKNKIKARTGFEVPDVSITKEASYEVEGIRVFRKSLFKLVPQRLHSDRVIARCAKSICRSLDGIGFTPELIVGHWASPNAQLLAALKTHYSCLNALVFHGAEYAVKFPKRIAAALTRIDRIGARSAAIAKELVERLSLSVQPFVCYSGIPDAYAAQMAEAALPCLDRVTRFFYAGTLMARKNVGAILRALSVHRERSWTLDIVGEGDCLSELQALAAELEVADRVCFHGRLPREQVLDMMREAEVFTMISRNEAFGLVYLEAMAAGCLTVGSLGEGIDGVIADGENGFLCKAGDDAALAAVYGRIFDMTPEERRAVAQRAKETAMQMTDSAVAERYLSDLLRK